jgi:hypothetical protein
MGAISSCNPRHQPDIHAPPSYACSNQRYADLDARRRGGYRTIPGSSNLRGRATYSATILCSEGAICLELQGFRTL